MTHETIHQSQRSIAIKLEGARSWHRNSDLGVGACNHDLMSRTPSETMATFAGNGNRRMSLSALALAGAPL